jgi:hypothetical protein
MPKETQKEGELVSKSPQAYGSQRNKSGIETYADWFSTLPLAEQQERIRLGVGPEAREGDGNYTFEVNPDHSAYATLDPQYEDCIEPTEQRTYTDDEVQEVVRRVVMAMQMSESPDCLFQARCILIAFGIGDPPTETELAKQKDCSRQFVSKKVKRIQQMFNLSPSQFMRSEQACEAYSKAWQRLKEKREAPQKPSRKPYKSKRLPIIDQASQRASKPVATLRSRIALQSNTVFLHPPTPLPSQTPPPV